MQKYKKSRIKIQQKTQSTERQHCEAVKNKPFKIIVSSKPYTEFLKHINEQEPEKIQSNKKKSLQESALHQMEYAKDVKDAKYSKEAEHCSLNNSFEFILNTQKLKQQSNYTNDFESITEMIESIKSTINEAEYQYPHGEKQQECHEKTSLSQQQQKCPLSQQYQKKYQEVTLNLNMSLIYLRLKTKGQLIESNKKMIDQIQMLRSMIISGKKNTEILHQQEQQLIKLKGSFNKIYDYQYQCTLEKQSQNAQALFKNTGSKVRNISSIIDRNHYITPRQRNHKIQYHRILRTQPHFEEIQQLKNIRAEYLSKRKYQHQTIQKIVSLQSKIKKYEDIIDRYDGILSKGDIKQLTARKKHIQEDIRKKKMDFQIKQTEIDVEINQIQNQLASLQIREISIRNHQFDNQKVVEKSQNHQRYSIKRQRNKTENNLEDSSPQLENSKISLKKKILKIYHNKKSNISNSYIFEKETKKVAYKRFEYNSSMNRNIHNKND